jgi:hypothetical protein
MSQENVEVVRHWFERLAAGNPAPEFCDPGIEIRNWAHMPTPGPYHGHEGLHEWWTDVNDADVLTGIQLFELVDVLAVDDERVVTIQRARGKARYSEIDTAGIEPLGAIACHRLGVLGSLTLELLLGLA